MLVKTNILQNYSYVITFLHSFLKLYHKVSTL